MVKFFIVATSILLPLVSIINDQYDNSLSQNNENLRDWQNYYNDLDNSLRDKEEIALSTLARDINKNITDYSDKISNDRAELQLKFQSFSDSNTNFDNKLIEQSLAWQNFRDRIRAKDKYLKESVDAGIMNTTEADIEMRALCRELENTPLNLGYEIALEAQKLSVEFFRMLENSYIYDYNASKSVNPNFFENYHWYIYSFEWPDYQNENLSYVYVNTASIVGEIFSDIGTTPFAFVVNSSHFSQVFTDFNQFKEDFFIWLTYEKIPAMITAKSNSEWAVYNELYNSTLNAQSARRSYYSTMIKENVSSYITPLEASATQFRVSVIFLGFTIALYGMITEQKSEEIENADRTQKEELIKKNDVIKFGLGTILLIASILLFLFGFLTAFNVGMIPNSPIYSI